MANKGWTDKVDRFDFADGPDSTGRRKDVGYMDIRQVAGPTSVGEQHRRGGNMHSDAPWDDGGENTQASRTNYPAGTPTGYNAAAYQPGPAGGA